MLCQGLVVYVEEFKIFMCDLAINNSDPSEYNKINLKGQKKFKKKEEFLKLKKIKIYHTLKKEDSNTI